MTHIWRIRFTDSLLKPTRTGTVIIRSVATLEGAVAAARETEGWKSYGNPELLSVEFLGTLDN